MLRGRPSTSEAFSPSRPRLFAARPTENITRLSARVGCCGSGGADGDADIDGIPRAQAVLFCTVGAAFEVTVLTARVKPAPHLLHSEKHHSVGRVNVICVTVKERIIQLVGQLPHLRGQLAFILAR